MKCIIIGPGGTMFYSYLGHMCKLQDAGKLENLTEISGASAGALCAFSFLIGMHDRQKLIHDCINMKLHELKPDIKNFITKFGMFKTSKYLELTRNFCFGLTGKYDMSFKELYDMTHIKFHVATFSLDKRQVEYFSVDTTPTTSVVEAVCMSISVPFLFEPLHRHIDGSVSEDIPYIPFIDKPIEEVYVMSHDKDNFDNYTNIYSYFVYVLKLFFEIRHKCPIQYPRIIMSGKMETLDFKLTTETRYKLFLYGYNL
jgi:predicted acylesterase/phospholipase RssA